MIYIKEREDIEMVLADVDFESIDDAIYELEDYAENSMYQDGSKGNYEDNSYYVEVTRDDLIKQLQDRIDRLKEIKPNL